MFAQYNSKIDFLAFALSVIHSSSSPSLDRPHTASGMHWGVRSRQSITSWHDGNASCTCRCIPIGVRAQTPHAARSGNGSKTLSTMQEVRLSYLSLSFTILYFISYQNQFGEKMLYSAYTNYKHKLRTI